MRRAPTTSRVLLALGALTLAVLAGSLLTSSGTAAAHEPESPPNPNLVGAEEGPCRGAAKSARGEADAPTLGDNEDCVEGLSKEKWYHQNYWFPCVGPSSTNCVLNKTANQPEYKNAGHKWHEVTLQHQTSSPLNLPSGTTLTKYLEQIEDTLSLMEEDLSRCGVGNDDSRNAKPFDDWEDAKNANCGHSNSPHGYFDHQPTAVTVRTRTVYVDTHNHCDDDTHPSDHDNDTCPEDVEVCEVKPGVPRNARPGDYNQQYKTVGVPWDAPASDGDAGSLCNITGYVVRVTAASDPPGTAPVVHRFEPHQRRHEEPSPTVATGVKTVEIYAVNEHDEGDPATVLLYPRCPAGTDHEGDLISSVEGGTETGCNETDDDTCPAVPGVPTRERQSGLDHRTWAVRVSWDAPASDGDAGSLCNVTGYEVRVIDAATGATRTRTPDYGTAASDRQHNEQAATTATGTKTVEIRARNEKGLGDPATVPLHPRCPRGTDHQGDLISSTDVGGTETGCNDEPPPDVCPRPAAPTVTKHGFRTRGGIEEQEVRWEVDDPAGVGCEVTGWLIYYGTEAARPKDKHETSSYERKPVPGSRIRVFVRAENRVRPGSTAKQLSNSGDVDLYGDDVTGARGRTHR